METASPIIVVSTAILTSFFTYFFTFNQYIKQRQREEVRKTYIEDGIGRVMQVTESVSQACYFNFTKVISALDILERNFGGKEIEKEILNNIFLEMQDVKVAPDYGNLKLAIFDNQTLIIWVIQSWAEYQKLNEYLRHYIFQEFKAYLNDSTLSEDKRKEFLIKLREQVRNHWNRVINNNEILRGQLLLLQVEADKANISNIQEIDNLAKKEGVLKVLKAIEDGYKKIKDNPVDITTL